MYAALSAKHQKYARVSPINFVGSPPSNPQAGWKRTGEK